MSRIVDNLIAYRILSMMVTPFEETKAFKLGIIDKTGKNLKKSSSLRTSEEKDAYSYLHRLVFNMKKIVNKVGGESKLKSMVAALFLVKEYYESGSRTTSLMQEKYEKVLKVLDNNVTLVEEEILVKKFLDEEAPVNATGAAVSTDEPKIDKKNIKKYQVMARRKPLNATEIKTT
jgi:hypothetical protein